MKKKCKDCKIEKSLKYFYKYGKYYKSICKPCTTIYFAKWVKKNLKRRREIARVSYRKCNGVKPANYKVR